MFILYDLIFLVVAFIYLPLYLFRKKNPQGLKMRLGILPKDLKLNRPIWIHAVSVGEAMAVRPLIEELRLTYPDKRLLITTVTPTGNKIARSIANEFDFVCYLPLDLSFIVKKVIDRIKPSILIITETEIWPNLISCLYEKNIPIVIVNTRISDSSFRGYLSIKFLLKPILDKINMFCVQTSLDAQRLIKLGALKNRVKITGNMKFDIIDYTDSKKDYTDLRLKLGLTSSEKLIVAGSTHPPEEEIILSTYKKLLDEFSELRLLLASRHPGRAVQIKNLAQKFGFQSIFISNLNLRPNTDNPKPIFILDTIGELLSFYAISDIVFVGGSLVKKGGHNILEPASLGKPIIFGPYMFNFRDIADLFLTNKAAILAHNQDELKENIKYLLNNPSRINEYGLRAKQLILQNQGTTKRNLAYIKELI